MSLSVCVKKVRVISPNGNLLSEGEMRCEDIETLQALNYEIIDLEEPTQTDSTISSLEPVQVEPTPEPVIEELPVEAETIQIIEKPKPIYAIYEQDIFDRSITLVEEITEIKANNIILRNQIETLQTDVSQMPFENEKQYHEFLLQKQIEKIHAIISANFGKTKIHPRSEQRSQEYERWVNSTEQAEINLEEFARNLGLNYSRRDNIEGAGIYYNRYERELDPIYREDWVSYVPTSSAVAGSKFN
tara:strand:- start:4 stop:738 length:735 start_codon:yes stop_codon:yes gene_type:complete